MTANNCSHNRRVWKESTIENWYTGEVESTGEWNEESTLEDIDLHRYHCTQCKEVFYYSTAARNFFEKGIESNITGLNRDQNK